MRDRLRRLLGWPLRRALDPRVEWTHGYIDERLGHRADRSPVHDRIDVLDARLESLQRFAGWRRAGLTGATSSSPALGDDLTADVARFLNFNEGPEGFAAQAGMWFNPPVPVEYFEGRVAPLLVNDRIVEHPFVYAAVLGRLPRGARVLDVGGSESVVALSLASSGYDVVVVDPRGYPVAHPRITVAACRLDEFAGADFDCALALSAVEHFGLGHYAGASGAGERADVEAVARLRALARTLVLTVPFGAAASVDDFQRVYDRAGLAELLEGWSVDELSYGHRVDRLTWEVRDDEPVEGVALVRASAS